MEILGLLPKEFLSEEDIRTRIELKKTNKMFFCYRESFSVFAIETQEDWE